MRLQCPKAKCEQTGEFTIMIPRWVVTRKVSVAIAMIKSNCNVQTCPQWSNRNVQSQCPNLSPNIEPVPAPARCWIDVLYWILRIQRVHTYPNINSVTLLIPNKSVVSWPLWPFVKWSDSFVHINTSAICSGFHAANRPLYVPHRCVPHCWYRHAAFWCIIIQRILAYKPFHRESQNCPYYPYQSSPYRCHRLNSASNSSTSNYLLPHQVALYPRNHILSHVVGHTWPTSQDRHINCPRIHFKICAVSRCHPSKSLSSSSFIQ
jgi:hypothetical protein